MAQISLIPPTSPDLIAVVSDYTAGMSGLTFLNALDNNQDALETRDKEIVSAVEYFAAQFGNGSVTGGAITAGSGLSVNVASLQAIVGTWVGFNASQVVGGFTASVTNYLFLRQDGTWTVPAAGSSTPPLTTDGHGSYLQWGTVTCDGSSVTSISNTRRTFLQNRSQVPLYTSALSGSIYGDVYGLTNTSTLHIEGLGNFTAGGGGGTGNMTFQGVYAGGTTYALNDVVLGSDNLGYISKGSTVGHAPPNGTYWTALGTQGATGAKGDTGAAGPAGAQGFTFRGAWNSGTVYAPYDVVSSSYSAYVCILASTNNIPASSPTYWTLFVSGTAGAAGADGADGADGSKIYNGSGVPSGGLGVNGDYYFETGGTGDTYYKSAGSWSVIENRTGPQGSTGGQGAAASVSCLLTLCEAFTPVGIGADVAEVTVPYSPVDGTTVLTFNVRRIEFRVNVAGGAPAITVQKSTVGDAVFGAGSTVGTVTLGGDSYEGHNTTSLGTVASGNKLRFTVGTLGTATGWNIFVLLSV